MSGEDDKSIIDRVIDDYIRSHESGSVLSSLMLSAVYKLATNEAYDLSDESRIYDAYLANHNIRTRYGFRDMFMDMMTGKDPTLKDLGIVGMEQVVLNEDGTFVDDGVRQRIAAEGRFKAHLGPRLVR